MNNNKLPHRSGARLDLVLVNSPLKDYEFAPRINDFTLPTLGLGYIATCTEHAGFKVELLDVEALGLSISKAADAINSLSPRWVGLNLLAPTYAHSVTFLRRLDPAIKVMLGGHQAKAMPEDILNDLRIPRIDALILGEAENRVPLLLESIENRKSLPRVFWRQDGKVQMPCNVGGDTSLLSPDLNAMPFLDRTFLPQDPYDDKGVLESAMVASRGCPFDCSFCGAAVSANPDLKIRMRTPDNLLAEIEALKRTQGVQRIRFVDDLFLANRKVIRETLTAFSLNQNPIAWDATGRINILADAPQELIDLMVKSGCREVALGIESGSDRILKHVDKKITVSQIKIAVSRLCRAGIDVKGYFILGLPTESREEHYQTLELIKRLWNDTSAFPGQFRISAFEYRPYPGTPDWHRLLAAGFSADAMLQYEPDEPSNLFDNSSSPDRDEFNFSTGIQFGQVPVREIRTNLADIMRQQHLQ